MAEASLFTLKNLMSNMSVSPDSSLTNKGQLEEAKLCWARGEHSLALILMDKLLNVLETVSEVN